MRRAGVLSLRAAHERGECGGGRRAPCVASAGLAPRARGWRVHKGPGRAWVAMHRFAPPPAAALRHGQRVSAARGPARPAWRAVSRAPQLGRERWDVHLERKVLHPSLTRGARRRAAARASGVPRGRDHSRSVPAGAHRSSEGLLPLRSARLPLRVLSVPNCHQNMFTLPGAKLRCRCHLEFSVNTKHIHA